MAGHKCIYSYSYICYFFCHYLDCKASTQGREYSGTVSQTVSGRDCQQWSAQGPHQHDFTDPDLFPDASVADADDYCRNPDGRADGPWCHTMDAETEWEYCDIPECSRKSTFCQGK